MGFSSYLYFLVWLLCCGDVEPNPGPVSRPDIRILYSNIRGLYANLSELSISSVDFDVLCLSETLVSDRRHISELRVAGFEGPQQRLAVAGRTRGLALYIRSGCNAFRQSKYECSCHEVMVFRVCGLVQNCYIFSVYRSPNADCTIFDCLLLAMGVIQESDRRASFVFVGDFNAHHMQWLSSQSPTDAAGRSALDFCTLTDTSQLVQQPTHTGGNQLDLVMTDVPDIVNVSVGTPIGTSDHCFLSARVKVSQSVPAYDVRRTVFRKSAVDWSLVRDDVDNLSWSTIFRSSDPVSSLNESISDIIARRVPTCVISYRSRDAPWFTAECRRAYDTKQTAYREWTRSRSQNSWNNYQLARAEAGNVYEAAKQVHFARSRDVLSEATSSHHWWNTLKSSLFGSSSTLPSLLGARGSLISSPGDKAELLSRHFDSKQSRDVFDVPDTCYPEPLCCSFAFRSSVILRLLLDLDEYGGVDPVGVFPQFFKKVADVISPRLARLFRILLRSGSFPKCWRVANVTAIPKIGNSPDVKDYRPISITPILSKIFEKLLSAKLSRFCESNSLFPTQQFSYRKNYGCVDALLSVTHEIQSALDSGGECRVIQLDFSAAFDRVNHRALIHRLQCLGIGGSFLNVCREFLSDRRQTVVVDGSVSSSVEIVSGVPQGSVLGPILFILYTSGLFSITDNKFVGYADDSTLVAVIPKPSDRPRVEASILRDLQAISGWCDRWCMKLNPSKTKSLVVSRSRTPFPPHGSLVFDGAIIKEVSVLEILGVKFDGKFLFEEHIRAMAKSAMRKIGLMRVARRVYDDVSVLRRCFFSFILPSLEYCSAVWSSAASCHLSLLDRVVHSASTLCSSEDLVDLSVRRDVAGLCMFYKIYHNLHHPLNDVVSAPLRRVRQTRAAEMAHDFEVRPLKCRTAQFERCFVNSMGRIWNSLPDVVFDGGSLDGFKRATNRWLVG